MLSNSLIHNLGRLVYEIELNQFLKTSKLYKCKCPQAIFLLHCLFFLNWHIWPHGELIKEEKIGPDLQMVLYGMQASPESGQIQQYSTFLRHPWRTLVKGNPPSVHSFELVTLFLIFKEGEIARSTSIFPFIDYGKWFVWVGRDLKHDWKISNKEV